MRIYWMHTPDHICLTDGNFYGFFRASGSENIDEKLILDWLDYANKMGLNFATVNPQILNWLNDDFAKENVCIKTKSGFKRMGDIKKIQFKFKCLGPGEIVSDTDFSIL